MPKGIGRRYIDGDALLAKVSEAGSEAGAEAPRSAIGLEVSKKVAAMLSRAPAVPVLVNGQATAEILGILPTHMSRYRDRLAPAAVKVEGTDRPVYLKTEVQLLAKELERERKSKAKEKA